MKAIDTKIPDVKIIEPTVFEDTRGFFMETWQQNKFEKIVGSDKEITFVQDNQSSSIKGVLRGLHYQKINTQGKLVRVTKGKVFDVAVDIRKDSDTFGEWVGVILSEDNRRMLWVPEGFAHGFYVLSKEAEFLYKCTDYYNAESNVTISWNDEDINIDWPIEGQVVLSDTDREGISLEDARNTNKLL
ncbi:dTDP-4-dehydrorhamnose 3,5-epimerase [Vibrio parahaemolyticus]|uniref:dTDP-4-dehydrorhamnose 3,5-epimerase n=1 Tax=Vibrio parahaemolyticus TaxID=670 RepID=A0AAW8Q492_VIBPH|nr:dTDP-4-dehydrorhamnose 3,5-epimerase [Vibrio parahaemolyticus]EMB9229160.1 dTDP-4-dehydrorhamnose 3,5-epimerase [Vibrio harveyi]KIT35006.1 hypothetical protein H320_08300 [Vibrio parahaemolyticus 49]EGQ7866058.1 dTDP-4-dehydrorhamnose 3,5-epimerase [Vibrio parahaemolyticus]EGQ7886280.1 dTDP-4-dehydrorhamnose 3,5-epimerase [Vibrio parahaemolyticus]EGQ8731401.1 dTDP-4-dehydrorhamnose 3,5-epimerase [Vibrio parahaemolyticus]